MGAGGLQVGGLTPQQSFPGPDITQTAPGNLIYGCVPWLLHTPVFHARCSASIRDGPGDDAAQVSVPGDFSVAGWEALSTLTSLWLLLIQNKEARAGNQLTPGRQLQPGFKHK